MIASLRGTLCIIESDTVTVECGGVGYQALISGLTYARLPALGSEIHLYVEHIYKAEVNQLIGFLNLEEKKFFKLLVNVPGVGPKGALAILSIGSIETLVQAIAHGDSSVITRAAGVGSKLAQRILLELKSKIGGIALPSSSSDALAALTQLGYSSTESLRYIQSAQKNLGTTASTEEMIRHALKVAGG